MMLSGSDLRYTLRQMGRKPGFVMLAAAVLAGGLAVSLMVFTVCYTMFYRPLPITNGERIVHVCAFPVGTNCGDIRADDFARIRAEITRLGHVGIYVERGASLAFAGELWRERVVATEWNLFSLSGTQALLGRTLQASDQLPGAEPVVVIGHSLWQRRLGGNPEIVGSMLSIDGQPVRIVGVMPAGYAMPWSQQLWLPIAPDVLAPPSGLSPMPFVSSFALLEPGVGVEQASEEIDTLMARNRAQYPGAPLADYSSPYLGILHNAATGHAGHFQRAAFGDVPARITMLVMNALALLVFLLGCINVGTLLLARMNERMKDISLRVALGASRRRLLVQICLESTFITLLGSALAVVLAGIGLDAVVRGVRALDDGLLAFWMEPRVGASTLAGVALYAALTILLTSVLPGWKIINGDFNAALRDGTRGATGLRPGRFSRRLVVVALMMVTLLLYLVTLAASTMIPVARTWATVPPEMVTGGIALDPARYDEAGRQQFVAELAGRMAGEPALAFADVSIDLFRGNVAAEGDSSAGRSLAKVSITSWNVPRKGEVDPRFSISADDPRALRLLAGRSFTEDDMASGEAVAIVSAALADSLWPGQSPLEKRLRVVGIAGVSDEWRRVVGLVSNDCTASFLTDVTPASVVLPLPQIATAGRQFSVRAFAASAADKARVMQYLLDEFAAAGGGSESWVQDPAPVISRTVDAFKTGIGLALLVGLFALSVALAGIYGLTQNVVLMAAHEIGVRRALGARDGVIAKLFIKRVGRQVLAGFVAAVLACAPVTLLFAMMEQEFAVDVGFSLVVSAVVIALLYLVVMLATYLPVRRVLRMEPGEALRYE